MTHAQTPNLSPARPASPANTDHVAAVAAAGVPLGASQDGSVAAWLDEAPWAIGSIAEGTATEGHGAARSRGAALRRLSACDRAVSRLVGVRLPHPPRLTRVLGVISRSGDHGYIWYAMAAVPLLARRPRGSARFAYVAGGVLSGEVANYAVKVAVRRQRPSQAPEDGGSYIKLPSTHSFPSAHATMGMVGLATMGRLYPRLKPPLTGLVALLAFTRAYLRVHYPADVVAGLGMGVLVAAAYTRLVRAPLPFEHAPLEGGRS